MVSYRQKLCSRPQVKDTKSMQMRSTTHSSSYAITCKGCEVGDHKHSFLCWSPGLALTVNWQFMKPKTQMNCVPVWLGSLTKGTFSSLATFFYSCWTWKLSNNTTTAQHSFKPVYHIQTVYPYIMYKKPNFWLRKTDTSVSFGSCLWETFLKGDTGFPASLP